MRRRRTVHPGDEEGRREEDQSPSRRSDATGRGRHASEAPPCRGRRAVLEHAREDQRCRRRRRLPTKPHARSGRSRGSRSSARTDRRRRDADVGSVQRELVAADHAPADRRPLRRDRRPRVRPRARRLPHVGRQEGRLPRQRGSPRPRHGGSACAVAPCRGAAWRRRKRCRPRTARWRRHRRRRPGLPHVGVELERRD